MPLRNSPRLLIRPALAVIACLLFAAGAAEAQSAAAALPTIAEKTKAMEKRDGLFPLYWEATTGKLWLEIPSLDSDFLYVVSLPAGLGSNDIGLDRSQLGAERVVRFHRVGPRVLLVQPNLDYRAVSPNPDERRAVEESFAQSVLWGFKAEAEGDGHVLVDATDFAVRDAHGVIPTLKAADQGSFQLDASRSAVFLPSTKSFPRNTEIEVTLTFTGESPGAWVRDVTPTPEAITIRERHSFIALPGPGYQPRRNDPRSGFFGPSYLDYSVPLGQSLRQQFLSRHRLQKKDPTAAISDPVEPIVYYLDRGVPEPMRSALLDGARWWNQAFEAAGFRNAFRVELLPEGADPMDVRYNVIQWVHRATRGWSYGGAISDPRTGEIIKGHVLLGSQRVRQDYLIAEGLLDPYADGAAPDGRPEAMALARLRQLAAHEVGHTLGLQHNYIASTAGRASVMDYPAPLVTLKADGSVDLSQAYGTGIGDWDKVAIQYGYGEFPPGSDESTRLEQILSEAEKRGLNFLTDEDARPTESAHPQNHLWDNGTNAADELTRVLAVRRAAMNRFGESAIRRGLPLATLEEVLVPLYLSHRYQVEAAAKVVGGEYYNYAMRGDGQPASRPVPAREQRQALSVLLSTLDPKTLTLPRRLLPLLPPRPPGYPAHRELFDRFTGPTFDPVSPAAGPANLAISLILNPERAARLVEQQALDPSMPGLGGVIDALIGSTYDRVAEDGYEAEVSRLVQRLVADGLMTLAAKASMPQVRATAAFKLRGLERRAEAGLGVKSEADRAHLALLAQDLKRFRERDYDPEARPKPQTIPPGSPIGADQAGPLGW